MSKIQEIKQPKILLVDDNLTNQQVALSMLSGRDYVVHVVNNGMEAIRSICEEAFDIMLMDVQMPVMNGYEATVRIREIERETKTHIHIIGLTANTNKEDREKCFQVGMDDFIGKPVRQNDLVNAIEKGYCKKENKSSSATKEPGNEKSSVAIDILIAKLGGNHKQIQRCLDIFKTDTPKLLGLIRNGLKDQNTRESKRSCHGLRGMLLTMEMRKAAAIALTMETYIVEKKFGDSQQLFLCLENEIESAISLIELSINPKR